MSRQELRMSVGVASVDDVLHHLEGLEAEFVASLRARVDLRTFAEKICAHALTFEAWAGDSLVGLVAAYLNDHEKGRAFITHVGVHPRHEGQGIGRRLLESTLQRARDAGLGEIELEVAPLQIRAQRLYHALGFVARGMLPGGIRLGQTLTRR